MRVKVTNKAGFSREVQYYQQYKFIILKPKESFIFEDCDSPAYAYYSRLKKIKFDVEIIKEQVIETPDEVVTETETINLEELSNDELKSILFKLGISTRLRNKDKLINLINQNIPEGVKLEDYID